MKSPEPSQVTFATFLPMFRVHAHRLIHLGYMDARQKIRSGDEEPAITGFIRQAIQNRLRAPNPPKWYKYYTIHDDPPVEVEGRTGRSRPRLDLIIEANWAGRPEYCFEAKRLRKKGFPAKKYVGVDGMGCFIRGLYASRYEEAAMIGYVQSDTVEHWRGKVKDEIDKQMSNLRVRLPQRDIKIIDSFPTEWVSEHERDGIDRPITIYHILLDCCQK